MQEFILFFLVKYKLCRGFKFEVVFSTCAQYMCVAHYSKPAQKSSEFPSNMTTHESVCLIFQKEFSATQNVVSSADSHAWESCSLPRLTSIKAVQC